VYDFVPALTRLYNIFRDRPFRIELIHALVNLDSAAKSVARRVVSLRLRTASRGPFPSV